MLKARNIPIRKPRPWDAQNGPHGKRAGPDNHRPVRCSTSRTTRPAVANWHVNSADPPPPFGRLSPNPKIPNSHARARARAFFFRHGRSSQDWDAKGLIAPLGAENALITAGDIPATMLVAFACLPILPLCLCAPRTYTYISIYNIPTGIRRLLASRPGRRQAGRKDSHPAAHAHAYARRYARSRAVLLLQRRADGRTHTLAHSLTQGARTVQLGVGPMAQQRFLWRTSVGGKLAGVRVLCFSRLCWHVLWW